MYINLVVFFARYLVPTGTAYKKDISTYTYSIAWTYRRLYFGNTVRYFHNLGNTQLLYDCIFMAEILYCTVLVHGCCLVYIYWKVQKNISILQKPPDLFVSAPSILFENRWKESHQQNTWDFKQNNRELTWNFLNICAYVLFRHWRSLHFFYLLYTNNLLRTNTKVLG